MAKGKMSDIEKIKAEIERRKKGNMYDELPTTIGRYYEDRDILAFIDSLPEEEPSKELEEAANEYATKWHENPDGTAWKPYFEVSAIRAFIAGAEWQKSHLTVEDIKTILDLSFWNDDPEKILEEYNRICDTSKVTRR